LFYDGFDIIFLKQADGRDSRGSGFAAGAGIRESDSAESENWNCCLTGFAQQRQACGMSTGTIFLFEDRREDGEGCAVDCSLGHFC
jgi:hypothetical protein